jgi:hypothetical protein
LRREAVYLLRTASLHLILRWITALQRLPGARLAYDIDVKQIEGAASNAASLSPPKGTTMNKLAIATVLTLVVSQAAGCIIETVPDDDFDVIEVATISARWSLRNMSDGATTACPTGFDTVELIAQSIDENGNPFDEPAIDIYDCDDRRGISTDLTPDLYQVWIEVRSRDLTRLYAQSLSQVLDLRTVDQTFETEVLNDGGYFQLSWDLIGSMTNRPLSCASATGANKIQAISTSITDATVAYDDTFACEDGTAVSGGLLQGAYTIEINALSADKPVGAATTLTTKVIAGQNQVTDLGTVLIPIDGL